MGNRSKGEGPYHNNPDKESVREKKKVQVDAVSVSQGYPISHQIDEASGDGMTKKVPKV